MEYYEPLGMTEEPFSNTPDPDFFYLSREHKEALNRLEIAIRLKRGLSIILGNVGTGKTTLCRTLLKTFEDSHSKYIFRLILDPNYQTELEFITSIMKVFGIEEIPNSNMACKNILQNYLYKMGVVDEKNPVLIIDEGQILTPTYLEILRTLLNYETNKDKLLQLIIFGQPELLTKVKKQTNFYDRINLGYVLNPMNKYDTANMIKFRLKKAGLKNYSDLFTHDVLEEIYTYTQGSPRKIVSLCHDALLTMILFDKKRVDLEIINSSIKEKEHWNVVF
ncbi:MAG: AAA family ATPase [Candidatus Marinimicrobia bacterium]|nr:AAA family ATPase [Candidatus Neomarinimicrobiota bacterium]